MPTTDPLVSTEWLAAHLNDPNVKVIDASFKMPGVLPLPKDDYLAAHIPGAVFFDVDAVSDHSNPLPHMFPSPSNSAAMSAGSGSAMTTPSCSTIPAAGSPPPGCGGCSCRSARTCAYSMAA